MCDALLSSLLLEAGGISCLQKKKFEQASVNTPKNKKGRNVELSWAWQKVEQQFHYKMHNIQVIRVKIYHVLLIIGAEYFLQ